MKFTFLFLGSVPNNRTHLIGTLLVAKRMANELDTSINKALIKGSAHESTIISQTGQRVPNPLHYTFHFKNDTLADEAKHFCAHANVELDPRTKKPINWYNTMLKPKRESDGRTPAIDPDQYFDQKKQKMWNKWDQTLNEITVFTEKDVEGWVLGDNFIAHFIEEIKKLPLKAQNEIREDQERSKRETEEAISKEAVGLKKS